MVHDELADAVRVLQLQEELIGSLQSQIVALRLERDAARQHAGELLLIRMALERLYQVPSETLTAPYGTRMCARCPAIFAPTGRYVVVCPACQSAKSRKAGLASQARRREAHAPPQG